MKRLITTVCEEYIYDSKEERDTHVKEMISKGYEDCGQIKKDLNQSFQNPDYRWYSRLCRYE